MSGLLLDWTQIVVAGLTGLFAVAAALAARSNRKELAGNGTGKPVVSHLVDVASELGELRAQVERLIENDRRITEDQDLIQKRISNLVELIMADHPNPGE